MHIKYWLAAIAAYSLTAARPSLKFLSRRTAHALKGIGAGNWGRATALALVASSLRPALVCFFIQVTAALICMGVEATYSIPMSATIGAGLRFGDNTRPYVTAALPPRAASGGQSERRGTYYSLGLKPGLDRRD
ncbi:MAG: hypothetical protein ACTHKR_00480 [Sphingomonas sp.]